MGKHDNTYRDIMSGRSDNNIAFQDLCGLLDYMGFRCNIKGDHYIFRMDETPIVNIQPEGNKAKGYQVRQIRKLFREHDLEVW